MGGRLSFAAASVLLGDEVRARGLVGGDGRRGGAVRDPGADRRARRLPYGPARPGALRMTTALPAYDAVVGPIRAMQDGPTAPSPATPPRRRPPSARRWTRSTRRCGYPSATTPPTRSRPRPRPFHVRVQRLGTDRPLSGVRCLVAEVVELQRDAEVGGLEHGDHGLEVVALLAVDPHGVALGLAADALRAPSP